MIRSLRLEGGPRQRGEAHGRAFAAEIRQYTADRLELSRAGTDFSVEETLALAASCLPAHQAYDPDLYAEMTAMAEAAGITSAEAVIVGGYTDFIDLVRARAGGGPTEDNCTAVIVPDRLTDRGGFLAQTWDMHASATPRVVMLEITPERGPAALVFSTVGCLGQIGMNEAGIAVGINNLTAADGKVGVTWPFVVRKALAQTELEAAVACVLDADLAGGHNFLIFDGEGNGVDIEAMPTRHHLTRLDGEAPLVHTNHCLAPGPASVEGPRPADLQASSEDRLAHARQILGFGPVDLDLLVGLTRDERAICRRGALPADYETCGAVIMRPRTQEMWACWGVPSESEYEHFALEGSRP
jgi:isopenicillin-N N-acyltransferase-like protein